MARRLLSGSLPFGFDDPENDEIVKQLLINGFGGAGMGNEHIQINALCTPLITANEHVLEQLALAETRYVQHPLSLNTNSIVVNIYFSGILYVL